MKVEPYQKTLKLSNFVTTAFTLYQPCPNYKKLKIQDYIWAISFNMFDKIPMWTGWNVINSTNVLQKQIVCYIKPIQLPHTRTDVVKETIKRSIDIGNIVKQRLQKEYNLKNPQPMITFLLCLDLSFFFIARKIY